MRKHKRKIHSSNSIETHFHLYSEVFLKIVISLSVMSLKRHGFISGRTLKSNELPKSVFSMKRRFPLCVHHLPNYNITSLMEFSFLKYMKGQVRRMIMRNIYQRTSYTISFLLSLHVLGLVSVSKIVDGTLVKVPMTTTIAQGVENCTTKFLRMY